MYEYDDPDEEVEIPGLGFVIGVLIVLSGCGSNNVNESKQETSVYSWNRELFDDLSVMEQLSDYRIDRIHQGFFPSDFEGDEMPELISALREQGIETAALFGDPSWQNADEVIDWTLKPLIEYNKRIAQLEKKVEKHNSTIERTYKLEERMSIVENDVQDLKK